MINTIIKDTLNVVSETAIPFTKGINQQTNWWEWIAIIEFGFIIFLVLKKTNKSKRGIKQKFKKDSLEQQIDFKNIIDSSFNSKQLYDELKVKCHPDLFPTDKEKNVIAENLFQEITKNRNNAKRLIELKEEATQKLSINFKI